MYLWTNIFFLGVSNPVMIHDLNRRDESLTIGDEWRISVVSSVRLILRHCLLKDTSFFHMEEEYVALDCFFWSCVRWGGGTKKLLLQWSIICFCITKLIVCLNSVWRASRMTLQRLLPILSWSTGPSYLQNNIYLQWLSAINWKGKCAIWFLICI